MEREMHPQDMLKKFLLFLFTIVIFSCSNDDESFSGLTSYDQDVIQYFCEVALGLEFGSAPEVTRKWKTPMRIFVGGNKTPALLEALNDIIADVNTLATDGFTIDIVADSLNLNYYLFFGPGVQYAKIFPSQAGLVKTNWGLFNIFWDGSNQIYSGSMYVDVERASDLEQKHLLREELTQSLGLGKDSGRYPDSIFQMAWTTTSTYASIDKDLIRLLYHPAMETGLARSNTQSVLTQILLNEK
jgi:hypothetical protein